MNGQDAPKPDTPTKDRIEAEVVALFAYGFEPLLLQRSEGRFLLVVDNRTGLEEINLEIHSVLNGSKGEKVLEKQSEKGVPDWTPFLDLPAGEYLLGERDHPEWTCQIVLVGKVK